MDMIEYFKSKPAIALVGASNDPRKYGSIIFEDLTSRGYKVIPINKKHQTIHGVDSYPDLETAQVHHSIELIVYVIPPSQTEKSIEEADRLNLRRVWLQPGAGNANIEKILEEKGFDYINGACVLVEGR